METKKFKINTSECKNGGKKLTKSSILSKAGFTVAGGMAGAAFAAAHSRTPKPEEDPTGIEEIIAEETQQAATNEQTQENEQGHEHNMTEPQPIDNHQPQNGDGQSSENAEDVDPNLVAQAIAQEVDPEDIDSDNVFTPVGYDYAYLPDGTRQLVIIGQTPDGEHYALADIDGDGVYGDIFDTDGNFVAEVDGLTLTDIAEMVDLPEEVLAQVRDPWSDDPTVDSPALQPGEELADTEEVSEDDLLAQLTEEVGEEETSVLDRIFGSENGETEIDGPEDEVVDEETQEESGEDEDLNEY